MVATDSPGVHEESSELATRRVLYVTYDGLMDPLGRSQVLPYLLGLANLGHRLTVISFEKEQRSADERAQVQSLCDKSGIDWRPLPYHGEPPIVSTLRDVTAGRQVASVLNRTEPFDLVHCRSYIAALIGAWMKRRFATPFLFDMRGFYIEERIEMGLWRPGNPAFRLVIAYFRKLEREFFLGADAIVSLTNVGRDRLKALEPGIAAPISVIPCCADFDHFVPWSDSERQQAKAELELGSGTPVLVYLGSISKRFMIDEMMRFFRAFREKNEGARFLFICPEGEETVRRCAAQNDIATDEIIFRSAKRDEVPRLLAAAELGVAFYYPTASMAGCSPTKIGEMLATGLPIVVNAGIGDVETIIADTGAGVVVDDFDDKSMRAAVTEVMALRATPTEIRAGAMRWFELGDAVQSYDKIYRTIGPRAA